MRSCRAIAFSQIGTCGEWPCHAWDKLLKARGEPCLGPAGALHLSQCDPSIHETLDSHGIALDKRPLINRMVNQVVLSNAVPTIQSSPQPVIQVTDHILDDDSDVIKLIE